MTTARDTPRALPMSSGIETREPPSNLMPETFALRLYAALAPLAQNDEDTGWSLLIYCNALGEMFQLVEDLVRDTPEGPGWSPLLDVNRCPPDALGWLAQFVGVRLLPGSSEAEQRARILSTDGFKRGTVSALRAAAQATLTGSRTVLMYERDHDPADTPNYAYYLTVHTYQDQTPDPAATQAALLAQKPAGIVLTYAAVPGQTWQQVKASGRTWAQVQTDYPTWDDVRSDEPA